MSHGGPWPGTSGEEGGHQLAPLVPPMGALARWRTAIAGGWMLKNLWRCAVKNFNGDFFVLELQIVFMRLKKRAGHLWIWP